MSEGIASPGVIASFFPGFKEYVDSATTSPGTEPTKPVTDTTLTFDMNEFTYAPGLHAENAISDVFRTIAMPGIQDWMQTEHRHSKTARLTADINDPINESMFGNLRKPVQYTRDTQWHVYRAYKNNCTYDSQFQLKSQGIDSAIKDVKQIYAVYVEEPENESIAESHHERLKQYIKDFGAPIIEYLDELIWEGQSDESAFMAFELMGSINDVVTKSLRREIMQKGLKHERAAVRLGAINGIACLEDRGLIPELEQFIELEPSEIVLRACERVLNFITKS